MSLLKISNLCLLRDEKLILDKINLELEENEILGLIGSSGCGKTSLLYAIAGLLPLKEGELVWNGKDISLLPAHKRNYGLVFQDHLLFPHKTVAQNLSFGLKLANWEKPQIQKRISELLELLSLEGFENRSIQSLSGGQAQRVSLGRALAPKPKLLMLDEPLAALDQTLRDSLSEEIRNIIKEQKIPAIYVTHDLREVFFVADRLALMKDGKIHCAGEANEMRSNPRDSYTATFFGMSNQFEARIDESGALICPWDKYDVGSYNLGPNTIKILILPEDVDLGKENGLMARVTNFRFVGDGYLIQVMLNDSQTEISLKSELKLEVGESCYISFNPERFVAIV